MHLRTVALALTCSTLPLLGTDLPVPPAVGDPVPGFALDDLDGDSAALEAGLAEGPLVLVFFRGVW